MQEKLNDLYEDLICLCEVRGELDPESNAKIELQIKQIETQIKLLEEAVA